MVLKIFAKRLLSEGRFLSDQIVSVENGCIVSVFPGTAQEADYTADILTPGLIDKHNHGALGFEANHPDEEKCAQWLELLAKHGVTNVLYTTSTCTAQDSASALDFCRRMMNKQGEDTLHGAQILGVHMEGPFINPVRCGAMDTKKIQTPSMEAYRANTGSSEEIVRAITMAPETDGAAKLARALTKIGVRVQAGHTDATCEQAKKAFREDGFCGVTHFYNAARPMRHRDPGLLAAAILEPGVMCEIICDHIHVEPEMIDLLIRAKGFDGVCMISDSVSTAGLPDGQYGDTTVRAGRNFTPDGGIAGAYDQMDTGVRNLISRGYAPQDVFKMASTNPAAYLGIENLGDIRPGMAAYMAAWDENWQTQWTMINGKYFEVQ